MSEDKPTYTERLLLDIVTKTAVLESSVTEIKQDLKEHMKRTATNEADIKWVRKHVFIAHGAITALGIIASAFVALWRMGIIAV